MCSFQVRIMYGAINMIEVLQNPKSNLEFWEKRNPKFSHKLREDLSWKLSFGRKLQIKR